MAVNEGRQMPDIFRRLFTIRNGLLLFLAFCVGVTFVSVGMTALLALSLGHLQDKMGPLGQIFESVNTVFSGLGFIALVVTFRLQYDELRLQRQELESQRQAMDKTQKQLRRSAEADIRACHVELMRMAMEDDELAEVWPEPSLPLRSSAKGRKQYMYANLIIQHQKMLYHLGIYHDEEIRAMSRYLFSSRHVREFWESSMIARQLVIRPGSREWPFDRLMDEAYYEMFPARTFLSSPQQEAAIASEPESDVA